MNFTNLINNYEEAVAMILFGIAPGVPSGITL